MNTIFNDVCVLVAAAFALTLVPGFRNLERSLLSSRDQGAVLLVFAILGLVEEATVSHAGLLNERIVAVCAAGLVAGPWVGLAVGVFVTWLAVAHHGLPLAALSRIAPREVPGAVGRLRQFLRASFDQHERLLVTMEEELALVRAYLDIESLRLGDRLKVEQTIDPCLLKALMPPFSFQPLVERQRVHALVLLRRRLQGLFGRSFQLEVRSEIGEGTTVTMRIPLRKRFGVGLESPRAIPSELCELASRGSR